MTHKSEDYKISAVKYYLKNKDNIRKTCKIFDCIHVKSWVNYKIYRIYNEFHIRYFSQFF